MTITNEVRQCYSDYRLIGLQITMSGLRIYFNSLYLAVLAMTIQSNVKQTARHGSGWLILQQRIQPTTVSPTS
jgi:hypothetical protein